VIQHLGPGSPSPATQQFIGGQWTESASGARFADHNPWTGEVLAQVVAGDAEDARRAIEAASKAAAEWEATAPGQRQAIFLRAADALVGRAGEIARLLADETGCGRHFANVQIEFCTSLLRQAANLGYAPTAVELPNDLDGTRAYAVRRPVGVVGSIATWNASLSLSGRALVGPIAVGNTVVLKPSEESPLTGGTLWAELFAGAGLPAGVLNVVTHAPGDAGTIADELLTNPAVRRINFTGSTAVGRRMAETAGRNLKRMVLQLSGQNALIVLADADLDYAVDAAIYGSFVHQGQICMCARRVIVEAGIADAFIEGFARKAGRLTMGDPNDPTTVIGPLINQWALSQVTRRVNEAVQSGARVLVGGVAQPPCYPATVLVDVAPDAEIAFEETFGPVAILEVADDVADAVRRANSSRYGLTAGILTGDPFRGMELARQLESGIVHVNDQPVNDQPQMPFGGVKHSGYGRFGLGFIAEEFTELQWVTARADRRTFPF
jgi:acyl-CoA reductase-like NAD-dependent aldehyde dehydrogenase